MQTKTSADIKQARADRAKELAAILSDGRKQGRHGAAASELYKMFYSSLLFFFRGKMNRGANGVDVSEDLTMQTLEKMFAKIKLYSPDNGNLSTWVFRIALNTLIDHKRSTKFVDVISIETMFELNAKTFGELEAIVFEPMEESNGPLEDLERKERHAMVNKAILKLKSASERDLIELRFIHELTYEEIAQALELPMGTVKAKLFRAKENLGRIMKPHLAR